MAFGLRRAYRVVTLDHHRSTFMEKSPRLGGKRMEVEIAIRYSDDRPCTMTIARASSGKVLYKIVTSRDGIPQNFAEGLREARRLFAVEPWAVDKPH
jgi:hypothetical protein